MSVEACAQLVERGDPDRFRVAMAAPPPARAVLFPAYAFNLEVARAPWKTREPMIAEMRLQWWRDVIESAAAGGTPPAHEVAGPLGALLGDGRLDPAPLDALVAARRRDTEARPFGTDELRGYLEGTAGNLLWATARALGAPEPTREAAVAAGFAAGLASWLQALPELTARGRGLADPSAVRPLAEAGLAALAGARRARFGAGVPALRAATLAAPVLRTAARDPDGAAAGRLALTEPAKRLRLLLAALRNGW